MQIICCYTNTAPKFRSLRCGTVINFMSDSLFILEYLAVNYADSPLSPFCNVEVMGYHDYGIAHIVQLCEEFQHLSAAALVKCACRFISQQQGWLAAKGSGYGDSLPLTARKFGRLVADPL